MGVSKLFSLEVEEIRQGSEALAAGSRNRDEVTHGASARVRLDRPLRGDGVTVRDEQLRVVEGSFVQADAFIRERFHEGHELVFFDRGEAKNGDVGGNISAVLVTEITATIVEINHLAQRQGAAIVKVRSRKLDVAQ